MLAADGAFRRTPERQPRCGRFSAHRCDRGRDRRGHPDRLGSGLGGMGIPDRRDPRHPGGDLRRLQALRARVRLMAGLLSTPRPMPSIWPPLAAGAAVILLALPLFVAAGWELRGWAIGAVL